jgi:hypothetical protein
MPKVVYVHCCGMRLHVKLGIPSMRNDPSGQVNLGSVAKGGINSPRLCTVQSKKAALACAKRYAIFFKLM